MYVPRVCVCVCNGLGACASVNQRQIVCLFALVYSQHSLVHLMTFRSTQVNTMQHRIWWAIIQLACNRCTVNTYIWTHRYRNAHINAPTCLFIVACSSCAATRRPHIHTCYTQTSNLKSDLLSTLSHFLTSSQTLERKSLWFYVQMTLLLLSHSPNLFTSKCNYARVLVYWWINFRFHLVDGSLTLLNLAPKPTHLYEYIESCTGSIVDEGKWII